MKEKEKKNNEKLKEEEHPGVEWIQFENDANYLCFRALYFQMPAAVRARSPRGSQMQQILAQ